MKGGGIMTWKTIIFSVFALLLVPTMSFGSPITVSSYSYVISLGFMSDTQNYTYTGNGLGPLIERSFPFPDDYFFSGEVVKAWVSPFNIYVQTYNLEDHAAYAGASGEWNFIPNSNRISLDIAGSSIVSFGGSGGSFDFSYSLLDTTDNHLLASDSLYFNPPYPDINNPVNPVEDWYTEGFVFDVLQNRNYRLTLGAGTESWDGTRGGISATVQPVPEPSTMLLLGAGLIGLWGFRKKFKK